MPAKYQMAMERILLKRYRILRSLGRGGLGSVYLCDDLRLPGKQWALKQMRSPQPGLYEKFRETFEREAATLSRLRHPNLPVIVDYFEVDEEAYLVMEFVDGENLAEHVNRCGALGERKAFEWGVLLAEILWYLHNHEPPIIFRDLKPENVMLTPDGLLKLVDFGLARRFVPGKGSDTLPSGSVGYAAPEQWEDLAQTDERSDIYSWGATLVYLLTAKIPSPVFPLSPLRQLTTPISEAGRAILARCVKARPKERYADIDTVGRDARRHLLKLPAEEPVVSPTMADIEITEAPPPVRRVEPEPPMRAAVPAVASQPPLQTEVVGSRAPLTAVAVLERRVREQPLPRQEEWQSGADTVEIPRLKWRTLFPSQALAAPLVLLMLATIAFFTAVAAKLPRGSYGQPPSPLPSARAPDEPASNLYNPFSEKKEEGKKLYAQQKWAEAIAALDEATTLHADDVEAHILKENAYIKLTRSPYITIPLICSMSGVDGADAFPHLYGASLGQSTINARGGIRGKKIFLDYYDDQSTVSKCIQICEDLVKKPQTLVVLGPSNSQRTLAVAPVFNQSGVNLITPTGSSEKIWESGPYIFSAAESRNSRIRALAQYVVDHKFKSVGVVVEETSRLSSEMARLYQDDVIAHGVNYVTLPSFVEDQHDFTAQVDAIRRLRPDVIFFSDYRSSPLARFAAELRSQGISTPLLSQSIPFTQDLVDRGGANLEGLIMSDYFHPQIASPLMRAFTAAFRRKFGSLTPTYTVANTFDAIMAVAEGLEKADTRESLNSYLRSSGLTRPPFEGVAGPFAFGKRLDARPARLIELTQGRFRLLEQDNSLSVGKP